MSDPRCLWLVDESARGACPMLATRETWGLKNCGWEFRLGAAAGAQGLTQQLLSRRHVRSGVEAVGSERKGVDDKIG